MGVPRPDYGGLTDYSIHEEGFRTLARRHYLLAFGLLFLVVGIVLILVLTPDDMTLEELLYSLLAGARGIVFVAGILGVLLALGYYYTAAGIDFPRETAGRMLVIVSAIGGAIGGVVLLIGYLEGRLGEVTPASTVLLGLSGLVAALGLLLQRTRR